MWVHPVKPTVGGAVPAGAEVVLGGGGVVHLTSDQQPGCPF